MLKLMASAILFVGVLCSNVACTTSFLSPAQGMGVEQPKIHFKKTRTGLEASASSNFNGDLKFDGEYSKEDGSFKGSLEAHVTSDASTVTTAQVDKIKAMENAYNKYADKMTELGIAQAQAWQKSFESLTNIIPGAIGAMKSNPKSDSASPLDTVLSLWNSLTPEQKNELIAKFGIGPK